jgi:hypothetical protein
MNQCIVEDTDFLAEVLGPGELLTIEEHLGIRASRIESEEGKTFSVGTKIPEARSSDSEEFFCPKRAGNIKDCSLCSPYRKDKCRISSEP